MERVHDAVDYFLRETHTPPVDFGSDRTKVDDGLGLEEGGSGLGLDEDDLRFTEKRFVQPVECAT